MVCVAILCEVFHQPLNIAWKATFREFTALCNWRKYKTTSRKGRFDRDRLEELKQHLRTLGRDV